MPNISIGSKGPAGPPSGPKGYQCRLCEMVLTTRRGLAEHNLRKHSWDLTTNAPATPEVIAEIKQKNSKKGKKKEETVSEAGKSTLTQELFGEISEGSDVEIGETEPPGSSEMSLPPGQPHKTPPSTSNASAERVVQLTGWDDIARPIDQTNNPCEKRRIEKHLAVRSLSAPPTKRGKTQEISGEEWPDRAVTPSVKDIIAFRKSDPEATPREIGRLADEKFNWQKKKQITSEKYVRGVTAGYDQARRELLDQLTKMVGESGTTPEDAVMRWGWVEDWIRSQDRPPTPKQLFED